MKPGNCPFSTCCVRCWPATFKGCVSKPPGAIFGSGVAAGLFRLAMEMSRTSKDFERFLSEQTRSRGSEQNNETNALESNLVDNQKLSFQKCYVHTTCSDICNDLKLWIGGMQGTRTLFCLALELKCEKSCGLRWIVYAKCLSKIPVTEPANMGTEKAVQVHVVNLHVDSSKYAVNNVVNSVVCVCVCAKHLIWFGSATWWQIKHLMPLVQFSPFKPKCHKLWNLWEMVMSDILAMASR